MSGERVLVVTGAGRGIGAACARLGAQAGYSVCVNYARSQIAAERIVHDIRARGRRAIAVQADIADREQAAALFEQVDRELGTITALVNNAGITGQYGPFAQLSDAVLRRTFDVNVLGTMTLTREVVRRWQATRVPGRIVNLSSMAAITGSPGEYVHYAATKAALDAFTVGLGRELARDGIRVNAVAAGTVATDIHAAGGAPDRPARVAPLIPLGRVATPEEIADSVLWLLSDEASYVTGSIVRVSGGL
jgi:NAD(P)-dependent dehydrogenase (short-subunit alcohol dehydrogenase family)